MTDFINPLDHPEAYEHIVLAGKRSPGVVTLSGHDRKIGWDIKKGPGQSGATTTRTSEDPVEFTCTFYLVRDDVQGIDDLQEWPTFLALIDSTVSGPTPKALDIYHPDLIIQGISSVVKGTVVGTVHDGKGGQTIAVKFLEYKPPKPKKGSPSGSKTKPKAKSDPNQAALDELAKLTDQYNSTPWKLK
jgi:hypothetical protein